MSETKIYKGKELERVLREGGFEFKRMGKGSHRIFYNIDLNESIVIPRSENRMLVTRELKSHGLI